MNPQEDVMKCCDANAEKVAQAESPIKLSRVARLGLIGTLLTCLACVIPLAIALLGVIGLARWVGYLDYVVYPLSAVFVGLLVVGLVRSRRERGKPEGET